MVILITLTITFPVAAVVGCRPRRKSHHFDPIIIDDAGMSGLESSITWAEAAKKPWCRGSGTEEDPYMIKNVVINGEESTFCMMIMYSTAFFIIKNCWFYNTKPPPGERNAGLVLVATSNGVIINNLMFNNGWPDSEQGSGIALLYSYNNEVTQNLCYGNAGPGIYLEESGDNIITRNYCTDNSWGIMVWLNSNYNTVSKNVCSRNSVAGIVVGSSSGNYITENFCRRNDQNGITIVDWFYYGAEDNLIYENVVTRNTNGIYMNNVNHNKIIRNTIRRNTNGILVENSNGNFISENYCRENEGPAIYLKYSNDNLITQNLCTGGPWGIVIRWSNNNEVTENDCIENGEGIVIQEDATYNRIKENTCTNNYENGIILIFSANYNVIDQNDFSGNGLSGISVQYSEGNSITDNTCNDNGEQGIFIKDYSHYNTITDNDCSRNLDSGIVVLESSGNIIMDNFCSENIWAGIALLNGAENNIIYKNELVYNWGGIYFSYVSNNDAFRNDIKYNTHGIFMHRECYVNMIYQNNIVDNDMQVFDLSPGLNNWYNIYILEGNYWSDYTGTDSDGDGIGESPWPEERYDAYPFMDENGWEITTPLEDELLDAWFYPDFNRLGAGRTVYNNKTTYLMVGMGHAFSERVQDIYGPPYTCQLWFYGIEVYFNGTISFFVEENPYGEPMWYHLFYLIIPPYTLLESGFPQGWNEFQWELTFYSGGEQQSSDIITSYYFLI